MSEPEDPATLKAMRREEATRWLDIVRDDIDVALAAIDLPRPLPGIAAYHLQQAAEKFLKAILVIAGESFRRTHDLEVLVHQASTVRPDLAGEFERLRVFTIWGIAYRYPGTEDEPEPEPSLDELRDAADRIRRLAGWLKP